MDSLKGHLLIASPHLQDPNFLHAVVLLILHGEDGTLGVVLNRPAGTTIQELWDDVGEEPCQTQKSFHLGGPVSGPLMAVHTDPSLSEMEILPGLHFAAQKDHINALVRQSEHPYRLFVGHSGWGGGQLENELAEGAWLTMPATIEYVFAEESELWRNATHAIGRSMLTSTLKIKDVPPDPTVN